MATDLLLADPDVTPRQVRSLGRIQRAGRDMEAVIDAFLILAREADIEPVREEIDVREVVAHEVDRVQPLLAGRPVQLTVVDDGAPALFAPPHVLAVMLGNLLRPRDQANSLSRRAGEDQRGALAQNPRSGISSGRCSQLKAG